jgi:O-antigen/teichoic acid export membrane protein
VGTHGETGTALGRIARGSAGMVAFNGLNFAATLLLWRTLAPGEWAEVNLALTAGLVVFSLAQWGANAVVTRDLVRDPASLPRALGAFARQKQIAAVALLALATPLALSWDRAGGTSLLLLGVLDGVALGFTVQPAYDSAGRMATYVWLCTLRPILFLVAYSALWAGAPRWYVAHVLVLAHAAATALAIAIEWRVARRLRGPLDFTDATKGAVQLWRVATPLAAGEVALQALTYLAPWAVEQAGRPVEEVAACGVSGSLAQAGLSLAIVPVQVLLVHLAARPDPLGRAFVAHASKWLAALAAAGVAASAAASWLAPWIVGLLAGSRHALAVPVFEVDAWRLAAGMVALGACAALTVQGRTRTVSACLAAGLAVGLVLFALLIPGHGARGAATAVVAGRGATALLAVLALASKRRS